MIADRVSSTGRIKKLISILMVAVLLFCVSSCSRKQTYPPITDVNDLGGRRVGVNLVWSADYMLSDREDMTVVRYDSVAHLVMALRYGQVDAIAIERPFANDIMNCVSGLRLIEQATANAKSVAYINRDRTDILEDFNKFASDFYGSEAQLELKERLNSDSYEYKKVEPTGGEKVLKVGLVTDFYPFCYVDSQSGEFAGSEVEVVTRFANECGYTVEFVGGVFSTIEMGIVNGEFDLAVGTFIDSTRVDTELAGTVNVTQPYMEIEVVYIEIADPNNMKVLIPFDY